ncbi:MAG: SUMF1/EgtB/PvdO family nonheme iron enzyme, partial [Pseudomonadota bacterium]
WQGLFPVLNSADDGFERIAPIGCFEANPYGLYDMLGNVWEWTADPYTPRHGAVHRGRPGTPTGVIKGGSFLCAQNYCARYRPTARQSQEKDLGTNHIGFRLAYDRPPTSATD